jgi:hypothetical protein
LKAQAMKRLLDGGKGLSEVVTGLGIGTGQLSQWRTEHLAAHKTEQAETQRLKREVKRLEEEVDPPQGGGFFRQGGSATKRMNGTTFSFVSPSGRTTPWPRYAGWSARA